MRTKSKQSSYLDRLRRLRGWTLGLGVVTICLAIGAIGAGVSNPKWSSNAYVVAGGAGDLVWVAIPLSCVGAFFLAVAFAITIVLGKLER